MYTHYIETDLYKIETLAKLREDENWRFRSFLKGKNGHKVDVIVHRLNEEISAKIDCTKCGNCCTKLSPCITKNDLHNLSEALKIPSSEVVEKYTETIEDELSLKQLPCAFFADKKCTLYQYRPETCHSYPHLHKKDFTSRLISVLSNYEICPIVFNVYERLKDEMGFRR